MKKYRKARSQKRVSIVVGDWNAEVKSEVTDRCKHYVVGKYANPNGNVCGDRFKQWASIEIIIVENTQFYKHWGMN